MIANAIICSLICTFLFRAFEEGMLLHPLAKLVHKATAFKCLYWVRNPIYDCLVCMCSAWGITYCLLVIPDYSVWQWAGVIAITGGLNAIIEAIIFLSRSVIKLTELVSVQIESAEYEAVSGQGTD